MYKNITKKSLLKLKDSKPIPITAHTHEIIVPCVYTETVEKFLDKKGIKLPLTHHQLAEYKRKAAKIKGHYSDSDSDSDSDEGDSHAKGTKNLKKKKKKGKKKGRKNYKKESKIIQAIQGQATIAQPIPSLYEQLRPNNYASIRPLINPGYVQPAVIPDYKREAEEHARREKEALDKYKKEIETRKNQFSELELREQEIANQNKPIKKPGYELVGKPEVSSSSSSAAAEVNKDDVYKDALDYIKGWKKSNYSLDELKHQVLEVMNSYTSTSSTDIDEVSEEDIKHIMGLNNAQDIYAYYRHWLVNIFDIV
jgi:hypothetical protein